MIGASPSETFAYALVALLVIIDPAGTAIIFLAITPHDTPAERRAQAIRASVIAFLVLAVFGLVGEQLLKALGIGLPAMKIAGGVLLFLAAADMVTAHKALGPTATERAAATEERDVSVFPLAIPLIAGPGAMTTMVLLRSATMSDPMRLVAIEAALALAIAVTLGCLLGARWLARLLGRTGSSVIGRVLGVLLAALAAQLVLDGVRQGLAGTG